MKVEHQNLSGVDTWRLSETLTQGAIICVKESAKLLLGGRLVLSLVLVFLLASLPPSRNNKLFLAFAHVCLCVESLG